MPWLLGAELGGTKLQVALRRAEADAGTDTQSWRSEVVAADGAQAVRAELARGVRELTARAEVPLSDVVGMGIGFGGPVDSVLGITVRSHQVAGWESFPLAQWASEEFGCPAVVHNDADTAALAEAAVGAGVGAGVGYDPLLYVTVGSGVGGGLVRDGRIDRGSGGGALEIGQLRLPASGWRIPEEPQADGWGPRVEQLASGFGISERGARVGCPLSARDIAMRAAEGDATARDLLADAADALGWALGQAVTLLNPARIVVGGGVSLIGEELFLASVRTTCRSVAFAPFADVADIVPAALGERVVVEGALLIAAHAGA